MMMITTTKTRIITTPAESRLQSSELKLGCDHNDSDSDGDGGNMVDDDLNNKNDNFDKYCGNYIDDLPGISAGVLRGEGFPSRSQCWTALKDDAL